MNLINILKELIKFKTITNNKEEIKKAFDFIEKQVNNKGRVVRDKVENTEYLIFSKARYPYKPKLGVLVHVDVIQADNKMFIPRIKNNKLYGRGSIDDKGPLVASLIALAESRGDVSILITSDEETGGGSLKKLSRKFSPKYLIALDAGDENKLITAEKGVLHFDIEVYGKAAHGSQPWKGINAIERSLMIYNLLKYVLIKDHEDPYWSNTLNLGFLIGGDANNKVPEKAVMKLDFRFIDQDPNYWKKRITNTLKKFNVKVNFKADGNLFLKFPGRITELYKSIAERYYGKIEYDKTTGATDIRYFQDKIKEGFLHYPKHNGTHTNNEWVDIKSLEKLKEILKEFFSNF